MVNIQKEHSEGESETTGISSEIRQQTITIMDIIMAWPSDKVDLLDKYRGLLCSDDPKL